MARKKEATNREPAATPESIQPVTPPNPWDSSASIEVRMLRARAEVGPIRLKRFRMREEYPDGSEGDVVAEFDALSHHAVVEHCRPTLLKHGILFKPRIVHSSQSGNSTLVVMDADFVSADDPAQVFTIQGVPGQGNDYGDKGFGKAVSYAKKMAYVLGLELSVGADNEDSHVETARGPAPQPQQAAPAPAPEPAPQPQQDGSAGIRGSYALQFSGPAQLVLFEHVFQRCNDHLHSLKTVQAVEEWERANSEPLKSYWHQSPPSGLALRRVIDAYKQKLTEAAQAAEQLPAGEAAAA